MGADVDELYILGFALWLQDNILGQQGYEVVKSATAEGPLLAELKVRNPIGEEFTLHVERAVR